MQRSKPETEKDNDRRQQGGREQQQQDDRTRQQQQQDPGSPRQPGKDPDIMEDDDGTDVATDRNSRKPKVDDRPR